MIPEIRSSAIATSVDRAKTLVYRTTMSSPLHLFIKAGCPWCDMAEDWLQDRGYKYDAVDVLSDGAAFDEMIRLSGQRRAPTLRVGTLVLADFSPEELADFLKKHSIKP
jgi:monothiol glutaredoxin